MQTQCACACAFWVQETFCIVSRLGIATAENAFAVAITISSNNRQASCSSTTSAQCAIEARAQLWRQCRRQRQRRREYDPVTKLNKHPLPPTIHPQFGATEGKQTTTPVAHSSVARELFTKGAHDTCIPSGVAHIAHILVYKYILCVHTYMLSVLWSHCQLFPCSLNVWVRCRWRCRRCRQPRTGDFPFVGVHEWFHIWHQRASQHIHAPLYFDVHWTQVQTNTHTTNSVHRRRPKPGNQTGCAVS